MSTSLGRGRDLGGTRTAVVELTLPAKPEYLILTRLVLSGLSRVTAIGDELLADLKLAVTEACGNAVRHAYAGAGGQVRLRYSLAGDDLEITVEDEGSGIDGAPARPADPAEVLAASGMGIAIMRATMDDVTIATPAGGTGTLVTMRKRLSPAEPATQAESGRAEA